MSQDHPAWDWWQLWEASRLSELDRQLGKLLAAVEGGDCIPLQLAAALASRAGAAGEIYLDLTENPGLDEPWPSLRVWRKVLVRRSVVGGPGSHRPLILDSENRLYLHRFWVYQEGLARDFRQRAALLPRRFNEARFQRTLDRLDASVTGFGGVSPLILGTATLCRVCVVQANSATWHELISALLMVVMGQLGRALNLLIAGPAVQRDSLVGLLQRVAADPTLSAEERLVLPSEPLILDQLADHRPLGGHSGGGQEPPLRADLVVVGGAEGVDLVMMANLIHSLPPYTRLVLLGDAHRPLRSPRTPFATLLAGPGQSGGFRRRLGKLLGETLSGGGPSLSALQNAVVMGLNLPPSVTDSGLHSAFWKSTETSTGPATDPYSHYEEESP